MKIEGTSVVQEAPTRVVLQKLTNIAPNISKALNLPATLSYNETWEVDAGLQKFLVLSKVEFNKYAVNVASQFIAVKGKGVDVRTIIKVRGLDESVFLALFKAFVSCEFSALRLREGRRIMRVRKCRAP